MGHSLVASLRGRPRLRPMERFDRLPPELGRWLTRAALPWSPHSASGRGYGAGPAATLRGCRSG
ncbi:DUF6525 family protein [Pseudogemmobacter bohemicus]|uniref:DUF6525 family protein n=1 Tax=Pseudogemmobacter bohemicus TaxID=2250708 RepID=UPI0018E59709|nr:DUF6525 family protein [Pseudogemmobacter bohemicus]